MHSARSSSVRCGWGQESHWRMEVRSCAGAPCPPACRLHHKPLPCMGSQQEHALSCQQCPLHPHCVLLSLASADSPRLPATNARRLLQARKVPERAGQPRGHTCLPGARGHHDHQGQDVRRQGAPVVWCMQRQVPCIGAPGRWVAALHPFNDGWHHGAGGHTGCMFGPCWSLLPPCVRPACPPTMQPTPLTAGGGHLVLRRDAVRDAGGRLSL